MENDYRITKLHGTFIGDNRIPDLPVGETAKILSSADGKTEWVDLPEGGKELELIEVSNATINPDGSYTYTLPNKPTSNPYILKTVDNGDASYYLMTGDSDVSFGMRPIALTDSFFGGNFMVVSGTTATQRPTNFPPQPKSADNGKVLTVNNGYPSWETAGGASVSPCLNLIDLSSENPTIRTSITEEEKTNWDNQLYNSILYFDPTLGNVAALSAQFPENLSPILQSFSTFNVSQNTDSSFSIKSVSSYTMQIGEKSADGTYPIGIEKSLEAYFGDRDGVGIIKAPDTGILTSEDGYNILSNSNELVYAGWSDINGTGDALMLGLCPGINKTATGEQEYCSFVSIVVGHGIGELSLKKDYNNVPRVKSFTTWLPPVTANSEGKALIVTGGNAQWTTTPRYEHTITIKNSAGKILWTQTMRNSSNTVVNSYANLKTLFGEATYAGFGEYCQLDLRGGTEATDKLIKADGTEVTLASLGAIVYTDVCFLPK